MPWIKRGTKEKPHFKIAGQIEIFHEMGTLSLAEMNDSDRDISTSYNQNYIKEYVQLADLPENSDKISKLLPSGLYRLNCPNMYDTFEVVPWTISKSTKLFELDVVKDVLNDFEAFKSHKEIYKECQMAYKRGSLLYGPPGTGKTSAINMIIESVNLDDVIVLYVDGGLPMDLLRELEDDTRLKVFIFEELTQTLSKTNISRFLTFLDGEFSLDNCYIIATTNYPEELPGNIVDRPGRFDKLFKVDQVSIKDKKTYLEFYLKREITEDELSDMKAFSMAYLKELILKIKKDNLTIAQAIKSLNKHKKIAKDNFQDSKESIGFSSFNEDLND